MQGWGLGRCMGEARTLPGGGTRMWLQTFLEHAASNVGDVAREALYSRGVTDEQIQQYGIGYIDADGEIPYLPVEAAPFLTWASTGRLRDVLVFPLTNVLGEVRGIQVRARERGRKNYSDFFLGEGEPVAFGLGQAAEALWTRREVWLVEGAFDLFPVQRHFPATVAVLSVRTTAGLIRVLRRLVDRVYLGYDNDPPGRSACARFVREHGRTFDVQVVQYPRVKIMGVPVPIKDTGDLWEAWGDEPLKAFVAKVTERVF